MSDEKKRQLKARLRVDHAAVTVKDDIPVYLGNSRRQIGTATFNGDKNVVSIEIADSLAIDLFDKALKHISLDATYRRPYKGDTNDNQAGIAP